MAASPSQMLLGLAACWLLASLLPLAAGQAYFTYNNSYAPQVFYHDPNNVLPYRQYCQCAFDVTSLGNKAQAAVSPPIMFQFGGNNGNFEPTIDVSTTGSWDAGQFSTLSGSLLTFNYSWSGFQGYNPVARVAPGAAYLANKVTVMFAGKAAPNWQYANDVIWSPNNGQTWNLATAAAPFTARSDFTTAVAPGTNTIVFAGGQDNSGGLNQVWQSTDGYGAVWTNVYNFSNAFQQAGMTFLFDSTQWGGKNPVSTLLLYNPTDNFLYRSTNLGVSFTQGWNFANNLLFPNQNARLIADADNNIYMAGGNSDGNQVLFSTDSYSWSVLNIGQFNFNITNGAIVTNFQYGCLAFRYLASQTAPTGYHRQLIEYGGNINSVQSVQTGFNCYTSTQSATITSVLAELVFPNEIYNLPASQTANSASPVVILHDASSQVNGRSYPDCAYDVHAIISGNQNVKMWHLGGFGGYYGLSSGGYSNTFDYTATGNWNTFSTIAPTYAGVPAGSFPPSGRVASGAALLFTTQVFLWFGGKDNTSSTYSNDVYASTNYGVSFNYVTNAPFMARSDFGCLTVPGTNAVLVVAGQYGGNGLGNTLADVWLNNDGQGLVWTLQFGNGTYSPLWAPVQNPALVALYDGQAVVGSGGQQYSTILLNTNGNDQIFMSTSLGASWTVVGLAPWSNRNRNVLVADMQNYVYMTGGSTATSEIFWSWNKGQSWNNINLPPNAFPNPAYNRWGNIATYQSSHDNCVALSAVQNSQSPFGVHKQLVLYGGGNTIAVNANPAPSCVQTLYVTVAYAELMFPQEQTTAFVNTLATAVPSGVNVPNAAFNSPSPLLTYRSYPTCAYDVHSIPSHPSAPNQYYLGGWDSNGNVLATFDLIQGNNFASAILNYVGNTNGQQPVGRVAAGAGVLYNGNLIWFGGKISASGANYINDVWYSSNPTAAPFALFNFSSIAPWTPRSDMACAVAPMTNCIFMTGGQGAGGSLTTFPVGTPSGANNDVWMSCDGRGAVWTLQTGGAPWAPQQQAAFVAMYDSSSVSSSYSQQYSTLVIYPQYNQQILTSTNQGQSWQVVSDAPWSSRSYARFVADAENNLYLLGCAGGEICDVWYSWNKGVNWQPMPQVVSYPYPTPVYLSYALTTCDFMNYQPGNGPNGYHRQLVMYGGFIQIFSSGDSQILAAPSSMAGSLSNQQCACDSLDGARAVSVDLVFSGETVSGSNSGGGGGSTSFSQGATAGIAVGVGVGCMLLCLLLLLLVLGARGDKQGNATGWKKQEPAEESRTGDGTELSKTT